MKIDCPRGHNLHEDVRVVGQDQEEHDMNLDRVMLKFENSGLTLNYDKCEHTYIHIYIKTIFSSQKGFSENTY